MLLLLLLLLLLLPYKSPGIISQCTSLLLLSSFMNIPAGKPSITPYKPIDSVSEPRRWPLTANYLLLLSGQVNIHQIRKAPDSAAGLNPSISSGIIRISLSAPSHPPDAAN